MERNGNQTPMSQQSGSHTSTQTAHGGRNKGTDNPSGWEIKVEVRALRGNEQVNRNDAPGASVTFIQPNH